MDLNHQTTRMLGVLLWILAITLYVSPIDGLVSAQDLGSHTNTLTNENAFPSNQQGCTGVKRLLKQSHQRYLMIEVLSDDLIHFETSPPLSAPSTSEFIHISQMIDHENYNYCGPTSFTNSKSTIETAKMRIVIDESSLNVQVFDLVSNKILTTFSYGHNGQKNELKWTKEQTKAVYGIAAAFGLDADASGSEGVLGVANGNWLGKKYSPPISPGKSNESPRFGNVMSWFDKGAAIYAQFPIMYAVGTNNYQYSFFFDNVYAQEWDLSNPNGNLKVTAAGELRWFVMQGTTLKSLRKSYMKLVGAPTVPPKEYFGLQHSIYGFESFAEMYWHINKTRTAKMPIDGMILDLNWFGGQKRKWENNDPANTRFGELEWDQEFFPDPSLNIRKLRNDYGVGVTLIEEPFIGSRTNMYQKLRESNALAQEYKFGPPAIIDYNQWWGIGGTIDWTAPNSDLWHDCKRCALIEGCVIDERQCFSLRKTDFAADLTGHWIDLGEPELYNDNQMYWGYTDNRGNWFTDHASVHNIFQLLSSKALYDGYNRKKLRRRPASMVRTGTSGIHRYGSALWSADVSAYLPVLGNHYGAQKHIIMGGIDHFGSDIGGFHKQGIWQRPELLERGVTMNTSYTLWLANSVFTDIPVRVHANRYSTPGIETNPALVGDVASNLFNIRSRYELFPYYYSLAHRANIHLEAIFLPMFLAFEADPNVIGMGDQLMLGDSLLIATHSQYFEDSRRVYLPAGLWYDYRSLKIYESNGEYFDSSLVYKDDQMASEVRIIPVFAKACSIIPKMHVDQYTMNSLGRRSDGSRFNATMVRVYPHLSNCISSFELLDDDGETQAYLKGERASTLVKMQQTESEMLVKFEKTRGSFTGAMAERQFIVEFVLPTTIDRSSLVVSVDGKSMHESNNVLEYKRGDVGYGYRDKNQTLVVFSVLKSVDQDVIFKVNF